MPITKSVQQEDELCSPKPWFSTLLHTTCIAEVMCVSLSCESMTSVHFVHTNICTGLCEHKTSMECYILSYSRNEDMNQERQEDQ